MRNVSLLLALAVAPAALAQTPAALVGQLGDTDFRTREAAGKKLLDLGERALPALEAGLSSPLPEVARRCEDLIPAVVLKVDADTLLAPTLVELPDGEHSLGKIFEGLYKQTRYTVRIDGDQAVLSGTVKLSGGRVPFWEAITTVCTTSKLEVQSVDAVPGPAVVGEQKYNFNSGQKPGTVRLRASDGTKQMTVHKALLVQVSSPSKDDTARYHVSQSPVFVRVFPEPKVAWHRLTALDVAKATDETGAAIHKAPPLTGRDYPREEEFFGRRAVSAPTGLNEAATRGELLLTAGPTAAETLSGVLWCNVWKEPAALAVVKLVGGETGGTADGPCGTRLSVADLGPISNEPGRRTLGVKVRWDADRVRVVQSAGGGDAVWFENLNGRLQPVKAAPRDDTPTSPHGISVSNAAGEPLPLSGGGVRIESVSENGRVYTEVSVKYTVKGTPAAVAFHAARVVELAVPFAAKRLPLSAGTRAEERVRYKR